MYVTAHRVRTELLEEGINAYLYAHGDDAWAEPPAPDAEPGQLVKTLLTIDAVGGNHVRSYLDIVAPDGMWWSDLRERFMRFVRSMQDTPLPWSGVVDGCLFRVGMEQRLAQAWQQELVHLYRACEMVHHSA